jgi:hypothetical protein
VQLTLFEKNVVTDENNFEPLEEMVRCFPDYKPFKGFYDLRCFKFKAKMKNFIKLQSIILCLK